MNNQNSYKLDASNDITIVSALYNIKSIDDNVFRRPISWYLSYTQNIENAKVVYYCQPELMEEIKKVKTKENVVFVPIPYEELEYVSKYRNIISNLDKAESILNRKNSKQFSDNYYLIILSKISFLKDAIKNNYHNTKYFTWIDFGISHCDDDFTIKNKTIKTTTIENIIAAMNYMQETQNRQIKILVKRPIIYNGNEDIRTFAINNPHPVLGGYFGGHIENMNIFIEKFEQALSECINLNIIAAEEVLFGYIICNNYNLFDLSYGDNVAFAANLIELKHNLNHAVDEILYKTTNPIIRYDLCKKLYQLYTTNKNARVRYLTFINILSIYYTSAKSIIDKMSFEQAPDIKMIETIFIKYVKNIINYNRIKQSIDIDPNLDKAIQLAFKGDLVRK